MTDHHIKARPLSHATGLPLPMSRQQLVVLAELLDEWAELHGPIPDDLRAAVAAEIERRPPTTMLDNRARRAAAMAPAQFRRMNGAVAVERSIAAAVRAGYIEPVDE